jgi:ABC-2 type transport system permease protein
MSESKANVSGGSVSGVAKMVLVVRREFMERVKTKAFVISTILVPVLLGAMMFAPLLLSRIMPDKPTTIAVLDGSGLLFDALDRELASDPEDDFIPDPSRSGEKTRRYVVERITRDGRDAEELLDEQAARVEDKTLTAYLVIPEEIMESGEEEATYYARNLSNLDGIRRVRRALSEAVVTQRLENRGVDPAEAKDLTSSVGIDTVKISAGGERSRRGAEQEFLVTLIYVMFIYTNILLYGSALVRSLIEEKTNRVAEVLLSSMTPFQLMAGKIIGIGSVGLAQFLIWAGTAIGFYAFRGVSPQTEELFAAIEPWVIGYFVLYFILGYYVYSTLFCIVGAMSTNEQEAQNAQFPVVMLCIISIIMALSLGQRPDTALAIWLSHFPFFSPILMFTRVQVLTPPLWEILLNVAVLLATIAGTTWLAGRVFRVGILMTGKRATIPELLRWVRAS